MSFNIAVAGKGGTGKTSIASLVIRYLLKEKGSRSILAVDADPNANLADSLGLSVTNTIGGILADFQGEKINIPPGMTKEIYLEYKMNQSVVESQAIDLVTMGRGEGAECYCYPNVILRKFVDGLIDNYAFMVMDTEAGMEHLSRGTTQNMDLLLIVSNHSVKGIRTIARIKELVDELKLTIKRQVVIINLAPPKLDPLIEIELGRLKIEPDAIIPEDEELYKYDLEVKPLLALPDTSKAVKAVGDLMANLINGKIKEV